jgi:purine-cytosine permease-like protein
MYCNISITISVRSKFEQNFTNQYDHLGAVQGINLIHWNGKEMIPITCVLFIVNIMLGITPRPSIIYKSKCDCSGISGSTNSWFWLDMLSCLGIYMCWLRLTGLSVLDYSRYFYHFKQESLVTTACPERSEISIAWKLIGLAHRSSEMKWHLM